MFKDLAALQRFVSGWPICLAWGCSHPKLKLNHDQNGEYFNYASPCINPHAGAPSRKCKKQTGDST